MKKFICIHGHFYQPPRENAWLEIIEKQESAKPFHDWNERISAECYGPNGACRILNDEQKIINIVNNYASISFNFGPTLLSWMQDNDADAYKNIIEADIISQAKHNGHGNAIAQVYNHIIMPLANTRDKETQIRWGIQDFKKRFSRKPEGMWLAETAVDTETLELLALHNIKFTILAPRQAKAFSKIEENNWTQINNEEELNTTEPYLCKLPSGNSIIIFFYNGKISQGIAFNGLLNSGKLFSDEFSRAFNPNIDTPQLIHVATDGETYGHHHFHGDMALASCIDFLSKDKEITLTNYAEYISIVTPTYQIDIKENSSWSCVHGVERWRSDCGCSDGGHPEYHQKWRAPLRIALDWLRDTIANIYENEMAPYTAQAWEVRNNYIEIMLDRSDAVITIFFNKYFPAITDNHAKAKILRLLEMQRHALLMFTSCAWFFDEVSRIETKQVLQYADRAIQIAEQETGRKLYADFLKLLSKAPSNIAKYGNAAVLHETEIAPQRLTLTKVGMHYAVVSLFEEFPEQNQIFNYKIKNIFFEKFEAGIQKLCIGKIHITSKVTFSEKEFQYAALYLGQHHIIGGYSDKLDTELFEEMYLKIREAFKKSRVTDVIQFIQNTFGVNTFSFRDLFKDEQHKILNRILEKDISLAEDSYKKIYDHTYDLINVMDLEKIQIPEILAKNVEIVINSELKNFFLTEKPNPDRLEKLTHEALKWNIDIDRDAIGFSASQKLFQLAVQYAYHATDMQALDTISLILIKLYELKIKLSLWKTQNVFFKIGDDYINNKSFIKLNGESAYQKWLMKFKAVSEQLNIRF